MPRIDLPGGSVFYGMGSEEQTKELERVFRARNDFALAYCKEHGWPEEFGLLTWDQIMEIRVQDGWKTP